MTSIQFVIQPLPSTDEQFIDRLREVSDKVNKYGFGTHRIFEQLKIPVKEIVIGPSHLGVLLEDGKAFRVLFNINSDRLDLSKSDNLKSTGNTNTNTSNNTKAAPGSSSRQLARSRARLLRTTGRSGTANQNSGSRSTGVIIGGSSNRPLVTVPATYVPEELISQAEVVLQGKSRNLIIRELQRTNLDVNLAVNNLLSRDDEDGEDTEEGGENYVPEDLISLLDNGFHGDNNSVIIDPSDGLFSEEIFSNYSSIRNLLFDRIRSERNHANTGNADNNQIRTSSTNSTVSTANSLTGQISSGNPDREAFSRWRDRQYYGPRRWCNKDEFAWEKDLDAKKKEPLMTSPVWISEELQPWPDKGNTLRFKKIAALYSELIAISENGELHQWKWTEIEPFKIEVENVYHPKTLHLNITEKIELISANFIRCSVVTESNRVATWMDEQLGYLGAKLEHASIAFTEFIMDPIVSINVCSLYTAVRTENNNIYWWGVLPFDQRRHLWDKVRTKAKKPFKTVATDILIGSQVIMKKCPIYQTGSIGFTCSNGVPKVGQLLNSVWDFADVCRFKILNINTSFSSEKSSSSTTNNSNLEKETSKSTLLASSIQTTTNSKGNSSNTNKETTDRIDMPPPPSPASSTCSDTGSVTSHKRPKRMTAKEDNENKKDEELWQLKDVVFVEDKIGPIGKVLKVDGDFVAVRFPITSQSSSTTSGNVSEGKDDDWQQCRLLRREDVQVYKAAITSRGPDWLQKLPKKININHGNDPINFQLLAIAVDTRGIHVVKKMSSKLYYSLYNLHSSKQEQNCQFPTDSTSFLGSSLNNISMICNNDGSGNASTIVLRDGNCAIYPLAKDCLGSIKDPHWLDLSPVKNVSMSTIALPTISNNLKSKVCMAALLFENQKIMPHILRCDIKNSLAMLNRLEKDCSDFQSLIDERCDGSRNIFHACTIMCSPTSNKDPEEKKVIGTTRNTSAGNSTNNTVPGGIDSPNSSSAIGLSTNLSTSREGRTISLREMMNRLVNNESDHSSAHNASTNSNIESYFYIPPWSIDANVSNNAGINDVIMSNAEEDISKIISTPSTSFNIGNKISSPNYTYDPVQRREHAILILQHMCANASLRPYLQQMLSARDAQGQTPFMLAVYCRAYEAGLILLNTILSIVEKDQTAKDAMIFPAGSPPDQSPLHVICYNDTCSFTWTGADHINQNIFECKTCGLTGSLCCCTECARVCHKGHDCKLKRTSPTAYCDCWEKCKCKALIAGNQNKRFALLCKLVHCTDLVTKFNSKGESILLFLIQTVGRQSLEQRQYRATRVRSVPNNSGNSVPAARKAASIDIDADMPEHDLEPPKFARKALERLLVDWYAVRAMIMTGAEDLETTPGPTYSGDATKKENYKYVQKQHGTTLLDKFTHNLFVKSSSDHLEALLMTLVHEMQNVAIPGRISEAEEVARRFVRSVGRVFVIFNLEKSPSPERRKSYINSIKHIQSCIKVFQTLHKISIQELCEVSEALIAPVRLGVVRPTGNFHTSQTSIDNSDELFSVEPLAPTSANEVIVEPVTGHESSRDEASGFNIQSNYSIDGIEGLREISENEEIPTRDNNTHSQDEDVLETTRNDEGVQDDESDNDFTFNDAETESDSDDNQSNQDAQRSVQTGATVGSETDIGVLFLEDESGDSSPEDASEEGETDEHSDEFNFADHQLERRNTNSSVRNDLAPQSMQWAIRGRDVVRSSVRVPAGSSLVFIDPLALRRSTMPATSTVTTTPSEQFTMASTASNLARAFGIIIRQIAELLSYLSYHVINEIELSLKVKYEDIVELQDSIESRLQVTWDWMLSVLDSTEAQLKFGSYLSEYADPSHPSHPLNLSTQGPSARRDFFSYCLSLMRSHTSEHRDSLPVLDVTALRHIAYVVDAFIFYMRSDVHLYEKNDAVSNNTNSYTSLTSEIDDTDDELPNIKMYDQFAESNGSSAILVTENNMRRPSFFIRSDSTLSLGCLPPETLDKPVEAALPLADKPHLLQPNSKRTDLFYNIPVKDTISKDTQNVSDAIVNKPSPRLGFSKHINHSKQFEVKDKDNSEKSTPNVYVQLKKKQLSEDTKPHAEEISNSIDKILQLDMNMSENEHITKCNEVLMVARPDVIVSPSKSHRDKDKNISATSTSATRSVIVRAGTSKKTEETMDCTKWSEVDDIKSGRTNTPMFSFPARGLHFCKNSMSEFPSWNLLLNRWKEVLDLFGRVFMDDVGMENGSILPELRGFPVKEVRFRRHMEKLRNGQQRDLILCKLERNRDNLILQTFKELNTQFGNQNRRINPPLTFNRVKVTFKDEPGEGSGVARSFYTSISEALLSIEKLPNLESVQVGNSNKYNVPFSSILRKHGPNHGSNRDPPAVQRRNATGSKILWRTARERRMLNFEARPYIPSTSNNDNLTENLNDHLSVHLQQLGDRLYPRIYSINPGNASKITGMILEMPTPQLLSILSSEETLRQKVTEALDIITYKQKAEINNSSTHSKKVVPVVLLDQGPLDDNEPLFYSPGKCGFYTPRQGLASFERINAFRNIGRLIGLCLQQNELLPLFLQRHVLKYILGRKIKFHDLAFFDPVIYESFRQLLNNAHSNDGEEVINRMEIFFVIDLMKEEGGESIELVAGGREIQVTSNNIFDYVRRYTEYRLIKSQEKALEALKEGVYDVLPDNCMGSLTSEDFRLLLNGVGDINVSTLISYTTFNDESSQGSDKLIKFKRWFWGIVEKMNTLERQDLVYFWTGSPALPASEEGFQPLPSVTIRPVDDSHLPTANTCISRLYIPLYSNKSILRSKLLLAIKSKNFGFV
ncbi:E3 ubiquitin-protein ligase hyd isoform X2 [Teleopsis dalmanni]|uniref:E3 ubiquitin-protein ligase hyd isoform X2 n=1 Tax=Teleopsis dalmanni TaxID=139649 RepID=UPI0018CD3BBF|nr:E3 ubiquitin-protein ligase hyd isoform X2 [Teleopsis dalmanni]